MFQSTERPEWSVSNLPSRQTSTNKNTIYWGNGHYQPVFPTVNGLCPTLGH